MFIRISAVAGLITALVGSMAIREFDAVAYDEYDDYFDAMDYWEQEYRMPRVLDAWWVLIPSLPVWIANFAAEWFCNAESSCRFVGWFGWLAYAGALGLNTYFAYMPEFKAREFMDGVNYLITEKDFCFWHSHHCDAD